MNSGRLVKIVMTRKADNRWSQGIPTKTTTSDNTVLKKRGRKRKGS